MPLCFVPARAEPGGSFSWLFCSRAPVLHIPAAGSRCAYTRHMHQETCPCDNRVASFNKSGGGGGGGSVMLVI